jgi:hypothetical protein
MLQIADDSTSKISRARKGEADGDRRLRALLPRPVKSFDNVRETTVQIFAASGEKNGFDDGSISLRRAKAKVGPAAIERENNAAIA